MVSRRDLRPGLSEAYPVILVVYDGQGDRAYWLHVQAHFVDRPSADLFRVGQTINVHLRVSDRLNRHAIQRIAQRENAIHAAVLGRDRTDV